MKNTSWLPASTQSTYQAFNSTSTIVLGHGTNVLEMISIIFSIIVLIIGLIGNVLVLEVFGSRYKKLKACEMFMVNLAVADLIGTIVVPTKTFTELLEHSFQPIGNAGCKVISFFSMTSVSVSALTLVIISIDRYKIVKWPLKHSPTRSTILGAIIVSWVLGCSIAMPYFIDNRIKLHQLSVNGGYFCRDFGSDTIMKQHIFAAFTFQIFIPLVVMTILYSLIIYELRRGTEEALFRHQKHALKQRLKQNRKATFLLVTIACAFYICVIPINIFYTMYMYNAVHLSSQNTINVFSILSMLQMVTSCVNPLIYSKLHTTFRRSVTHYFRICWQNKSHANHSTIVTTT